MVIYQAIDSVQRYLRDTLGFKDTVSGQALIRNFPTKANAHWNTDDNSFYSASADNGRGALHFGDGGVDDAEDADIIVHEFGHAIQNDQNPGCFPAGEYKPQEDEAGAIAEGFSDYLAASFFAENENGNPTYQLQNAACVGDWDQDPTVVLLPRVCVESMAINTIPKTWWVDLSRTRMARSGRRRYGTYVLNWVARPLTS